MGARPRTSATGTTGSSRSAAARRGPARRPPRARPPRSSLLPVLSPSDDERPHLVCSARTVSSALKRQRARRITQARRRRACTCSARLMLDTSSCVKACSSPLTRRADAEPARGVVVATAHRFSRVPWPGLGLFWQRTARHTPGGIPRRAAEASAFR
jgi:hypothetical protein